MTTTWPWLAWCGLLWLSLVAAREIVRQEWTDADLPRLQEYLSTNEHRLFFFHGKWCGACQSFKPEFEVQIKQLEDEGYGVTETLGHNEILITSVVSIDVSIAKELVGRFRLTHIPAVYHQKGQEFRRIDQFRGRLGAYFSERGWLRLPPISTVLDPNSLAGRAVGGAVSLGARIAALADTLGITINSLFLIAGMLVLLFMLFSAAFLWLLADYRMKQSFIQDEAHQQACIRILSRDNDCFEGSDESDECGTASETEPEEDDKEQEDEHGAHQADRTLLRKRRYSH